MSPSPHTRWQLRTALITVAVLLMALAFVLIDRSGSILTGSLTSIGTKGGRTITQISFDPAETSEVLPVDHLNIILIPDTADIADGAPLSLALTQGKRIFGYKYSSWDASAEIAAQARAENGEPLSYSQLFTGQFFVSEEARNDGNFITNVEQQKHISFLALTGATLEKDARYVVIVDDADVRLTARGLFADAPQCSDGLDNDSDGLTDHPEDPQCSSPQDYDEGDGLVSIGIAVTDDSSIKRVELYVNDVLTETGTSIPYGFTWDTNALPNGSYTLRASAVDAAGNVGQSSIVNISLDSH